MGTRKKAIRERESDKREREKERERERKKERERQEQGTRLPVLPRTPTASQAVTPGA
jgi:hypothetical protein